MKKAIKAITTILLCFLLIPIVAAQEAVVPANDPGVTPDSFLWGLDKALEQLNLLLTFDEGEKVRKGLEVARERLLEVKVMVEENKLDAANRAKDNHGQTLLKVKERVRELEEEDALEEIEELIEVERELEEHQNDVEETFSELKVKIKVQGELTPQQRELIDSLLNSLQGQTGEVEIEIENKKDKIKIKIEQKTGKSEQEIEVEIENIEKEKGIKKQEKALEAIGDAEEELDELLKEKEEGIVVPPDVLEQFNSLLEQARSQFELGNFAEARQLAKEAENLLDDLDEEEEEGEEEEKEIEVEVEKGRAKVKVEVGKEELEFQLDTTDLKSIVDEIAARTGLAVEEIEAILEVKVEEEEIEIEAEAEKGKTRVKVEVNGEKKGFILDMTSEEEVIAEIMARTGLSEEEVRANLEFEAEEEEENSGELESDEEGDGDSGDSDGGNSGSSGNAGSGSGGG